MKSLFIVLLSIFSVQVYGFEQPSSSAYTSFSPEEEEILRSPLGNGDSVIPSSSELPDINEADVHLYDQSAKRYANVQQEDDMPLSDLMPTEMKNKQKSKSVKSKAKARTIRMKF